jgi:hypothetical protein
VRKAFAVYAVDVRHGGASDVFRVDIARDEGM